MLKHLFCISSIFVLLSTSVLADQLDVSVLAESAILINAETGRVLFEKQSHQLQYPASTTKIATALYALKKKKDGLNELILAEQDSIASITDEQMRRSNYSLPAYWLTPGGTHIGIKKGEQLALKDLLYGMMIASGNDAANVIAQHVSGSIPNFMSELNTYLRSIGCSKTNFLNPHGLFHPQHQTTALDLATMTREAMKDPMFRQIVSTVRYTRPKTNKQDPTTLVQSNRLLRQGDFFYPHAIGVKTGYLSLAQNTLVAAAEKDGRTLIAVLLKTKERPDSFRDAIRLFEAAYAEKSIQRLLLKKGPQQFTVAISGGARPLETYLKDDLVLEYYPAEMIQTKSFLYWDQLQLPISKDQRVGELRIQDEAGQVVAAGVLYANAEVDQSFGTRLKALFRGSRGHIAPIWKVLAVLGVIGLMFLLFLRIRTR